MAALQIQVFRPLMSRRVVWLARARLQFLMDLRLRTAGAGLTLWAWHGLSCLIAVGFLSGSRTCISMRAGTIRIFQTTALIQFGKKLQIV